MAAVQTRLQPRYLLQKLFIIGLCIVMGLWGVYDYVVKIPARARAYERGQVCQIVKHALEAQPGDPGTRTAITEALGVVTAEVQTQLAAGLAERQSTDATGIDVVTAIEARDEADWLKVLVLFGAALQEAERRSPASQPSATFTTAFDVARAGINATADVTPPSKFDRATQWMFILCLPVAPFVAWGLIRDRRRVFRREEDGTLHTPVGQVSPDQIADIDMSRWMKKSIAVLELTDGRTIKLDDYVHKHTDEIVGAIAAERHPDAWQADARPVKAGAAPEPVVETREEEPVA